MDPHCPQCQILIDSEKRQMNKYKVCHDAFESAMVLNDTLAARVKELEAEQIENWNIMKRDGRIIVRLVDLLEDITLIPGLTPESGLNLAKLKAQQGLRESAAILETRTKEKSE